MIRPARDDTPVPGTAAVVIDTLTREAWCTDTLAEGRDLAATRGAAPGMTTWTP